MHGKSSQLKWIKQNFLGFIYLGNEAHVALIEHSTAGAGVKARHVIAKKAHLTRLC